MSEVKEVTKEVAKPQPQEMSVLQQMKAQHQFFIAQRDQAYAQHQQCIGAVFACETMIQQHEASLKLALQKLAQDVAKSQSPDNQGEIKDGKAHVETAKQPPQK